MESLYKDYEVVRVLGKGSFGSVALTRKIKDRKKMYAMKLYYISQLAKTNKIYSITRSRMILQKLQHRGIIRMEDYATDQRKEFLLLTFEACRYGDLGEFLLHNFKRLSMNVKKFFVGEIGQILQYLHSKEVVHRDIKPSNFVLGEDGRLKLIDFDEAITFKKDLLTESDNKKIMEKKYGNIREEDRIELEILEQSRKRQATYVGTPSYMAPEFHDEKRQVDERCDIFSFGCVIYELLTGKVLQTEQLEPDEQAEHISKSLDNIPKNIPPEMLDLLAKTLQVQPHNRTSIFDIVKNPYFKLSPAEEQAAKREIKGCLKKRQREPYSKIKEEYEFSPFFGRFPLAEQLKLNLLVLTKARFFYRPRFLCSSFDCLRMYEQEGAAMEVQVPDNKWVLGYDQIECVTIDELRNAVCISRTRGGTIRLKVASRIFQHINDSMTKLLYERIKSCIDQ